MNKRKYRPFVLSLLFLTNNSESLKPFCVVHSLALTHITPSWCRQLNAITAVRPGSCQAGRLPAVCALHHFTKWRTLYCAVESAVLFPVANSRHFLLRHMFVLLLIKCCAGHQNSPTDLSITPTLMLRKVPCWFSSDIRNSYCAVLARTTNSAHSPPATQSPHCTALHRALTILAGSDEILLDQVCTQICRKMKKNLRSVCLEWNEESENAKKNIVLLL